jgi:hypothetical protein
MPVTPRVPKETPMYEPETGKMSRTWVIFFERLGNWTQIVNAAGDTSRKATFVIKRDLEVAEELTNHYIVRASGALYDAAATVIVPPVGASAQFDIEKSEDGGETWTSILNPDPGYLEIPDGNPNFVEQWGSEIFHPDPEIARVTYRKAPELTDLLRINGLQAGSTTPGKDFTIVIRWQ